MTSFYVEPEVAGGLGPRTVLDRTIHPPLVKRLHYEFEGWLGDAIVESFPVFVVTDKLASALTAMSVTGARFDEVEVTVTDEFGELYPDRKLPSFRWLRPAGKVGVDDIASASDGRLIVSQRVLELFQKIGISHAVVEPMPE